MFISCRSNIHCCSLLTEIVQVEEAQKICTDTDINLEDGIEDPFYEEVAELDNGEDDSSILMKPKRKPPTSCTKQKWTFEEEAEIKNIFKKFFEKKQRPTPNDCQQAIKYSQKKGGLICKRSKDTLKKKLFRMIDAVDK